MITYITRPPLFLSSLARPHFRRHCARFSFTLAGLWRRLRVFLHATFLLSHNRRLGGGLTLFSGLCCQLFFIPPLTLETP